MTPTAKETERLTGWKRTGWFLLTFGALAMGLTSLGYALRGPAGLCA